MQRIDFTSLPKKPPQNGAILYRVERGGKAIEFQNLSACGNHLPSVEQVINDFFPDYDSWAACHFIGGKAEPLCGGIRSAGRFAHD